MEEGGEDETPRNAQVLLGKRMSLVLKKINVKAFTEKKYTLVLDDADFIYNSSSDDDNILPLLSITGSGFSKRSGRKITPNKHYHSSIYSGLPLFYLNTNNCNSTPSSPTSLRTKSCKTSTACRTPSTLVKSTVYDGGKTLVSNGGTEDSVDSGGLHDQEQLIFESTFSTTVSSPAKRVKKSEGGKRKRKKKGQGIDMQLAVRRKHRVNRDSSPGLLLEEIDDNEDSSDTNERDSDSHYERRSIKRRRIIDEDSSLDENEDDSFDELAKLREQMQLDSPQETTTTTVVVYADTEAIANTRSIEVESIQALTHDTNTEEEKEEIRPLTPHKDQVTNVNLSLRTDLLVLNEEDLLYSHEIDLLADTTPTKTAPTSDDITMETKLLGNQDVLADALSMGMRAEALPTDVDLLALMDYYDNTDISVLEEGSVREQWAESTSGEVSDLMATTMGTPAPPTQPTASATPPDPLTSSPPPPSVDPQSSSSLPSLSSQDIAQSSQDIAQSSQPSPSLPPPHSHAAHFTASPPPLTQSSSSTLLPLPFSSFLEGGGKVSPKIRLTRSSQAKASNKNPPTRKDEDQISRTPSSSPCLPSPLNSKNNSKKLIHDDHNFSTDAICSPVIAPPTRVLATPTKLLVKTKRVKIVEPAEARDEEAPPTFPGLGTAEIEQPVGYSPMTSLTTPTNNDKAKAIETGEDGVNDDRFVIDEDDVISLMAEDTFDQSTPLDDISGVGGVRKGKRGNIFERLGHGKKSESETKKVRVWDRLGIGGAKQAAEGKETVWDRIGGGREGGGGRVQERMSIKKDNGQVEDFKKEQVSSWVAQQQRQAPPMSSRLSTPSPYSSPSSSHSFNSNGHTLNYIPPTRGTSPVIIGLDSKMLRQPDRSIPYSLLCPFVCGSDRHLLVKRHFPLLLKLFRSILDNKFPLAGKTYISLRDNSSISFQPSVLRPLLSMCSTLMGLSVTPIPYLVAQKVYDDLKSLLRGRVTSTDHLNLIKTLMNYQRYTNAMEYYRSTASLGLSLTSEHMHVILPAVKGLGSHVTKILDDAAKCFKITELASYVDDVIGIMDRKVLLIHANQLLGWFKCNGKVLSELSCKTLSAMLSVFMDCGQLMGGIYCLEVSKKHVSSLGSVVSQLSLKVLHEWSSSSSSTFSEGIKKLLSIIKLMSHEQLVCFSAQDWEMLLSYGMQFNYINMSQWLFKTASQLKKLISKKTQFNLLCYFIDQNCIELTSDVIKVFLSTPPPPSSYLLELCGKLQSRPAFTCDLYSIIIVLLQVNEQPPLPSLKWLFTYHKKYEESYHLLANIVKQASTSKVQLDSSFYKSVLPELRTWGKDSEALKAVYRSLRNLELSPEEFKEEQECVDSNNNNNNAQTSSSSGVGSSPTFSVDSNSTNGYHLTSGSEEKPKPTTNTPTSNTTTSCTDTSTNNPNHSLCSLIKESGSQGQFGAVAAILTNLPSNAMFSLDILQSTLSGLINGPLQAFQGLHQLITSLKKAADDGVLTSHDLWIGGQIGVYLLCQSSNSNMWNEAFYVLHSLHLCGVHYVGVSPPHLLSPPPSSCSVAIKAVTCCLKTGKLSAVMQVLEGCHFITYDSKEEEEARADLLLNLANDFHDNGDFDESFTCILKVLTGIPSQYRERMISTVTGVISSWLTTARNDEERKAHEESKLVQVINNLFEAEISLPCKMFSHFISHLISRDEEGHKDEARKLITLAITSGCYHVTDTKPQSILLPCHLTLLEINMILYDHLIRNTLTTQDFEIICPSSLRATVERCLATGFSPSLSITSRTARPPTSVALLVSSLSLSNWYKAEDKNKKKAFKRLICEHVTNELKPYCKGKRIKSEDDHIHLVSVLCQYFFKNGKASDWIVTAEIISSLRSVIRKLFDSVSCYDASIPLHDILSSPTATLITVPTAIPTAETCS